VSEWLQSQPHIRRTGLIGFCWGANQALLAAWYDGRAEKHVSISERLAEHVRPVSLNRHFEAGVIAFSPVLRFEEIDEALDETTSKWQHPVLASLGDTARERMIFKKHPNPRGKLRALMDAEFARSELNYPGAVDEGLDFIRFLPHRGMPDGNKLADCRVPVLIVQAANDPLAVAQGVADLFGKVANPNVAGIILANGGHIGFPAYARSYYFSLIVNFFDSRTGPGAFVPIAVTPSPGCRAK
jgi:pimeloyl-ACP methyl ester carboxylesterase